MARRGFRYGADGQPEGGKDATMTTADGKVFTWGQVSNYNKAPKISAEAKEGGTKGIVVSGAASSENVMTAKIKAFQKGEVKFAALKNPTKAQKAAMDKKTRAVIDSDASKGSNPLLGKRGISANMTYAEFKKTTGYKKVKSPRLQTKKEKAALKAARSEKAFDARFVKTFTKPKAKKAKEKTKTKKAKKAKAAPRPLNFNVEQAPF